MMLRKSNERGLILPAFFASAFENELEYLYVRINRSDDHATSDINLVGHYPQSSYESTVYNKRLSALGFVYLRLSGG